MDAINIIKLFDLRFYSKKWYSNQILNIMFKYLKKLKKYNIFINLIKIKAHIGIFQNERVDSLAKQACFLTKNYDGLYINNFETQMKINLKYLLID